MSFEDRLAPEQQYVFTDSHRIEELAGLDIGTEVSISGRVLAHRHMKNYDFLDVHDDTGSIQIISAEEQTEAHGAIGAVGIGDYIGVEGQIGYSRSGQLSVDARDWVRLARTEVPFPDKREGLSDPDTIARQRYLDLATNPESMARFRARSRIVLLTREFMADSDFIEVETPVLQAIHGGAAARPFMTHHNALDMELSLRIAPELYLKRLVVGGFKRVFEIGKVFRNEGVSVRHNPEFTMMEAYAAGWDYEDQMRLTEDLVASLSESLHGTTQIDYQGRAVDLSTPWERRSMDSLVSEKFGRELSMDTDIEELRALCDANDVEYDESFGPGKLLLELYEKTVEGTLWNPTFVTDYPVEVSPLARAHRTRPGYTERFEGIVAGRELCNAFTELNDPRVQYERFASQEATAATDAEAMRMDLDYVRALRYGLPPTAGMGIGIDRLVMLLTDARSIRDVVLFPTMKPEAIADPYWS